MPRYRTTLLLLLLHVLSVLLLCHGSTLTRADERLPNVLVILTDDQGYGDFGHYDNPRLDTPTLDRLARESARFNRFYVSPVCSPTRASLMTGRYNYRTGVVDTYLGRSMMHPDEVTLAEMFRAGGYRTGIFGKWHLGDNYPLRPQDQGFDDSLIHLGGGIGQPADPPDNLYQDPLLQLNGQSIRKTGYCSDIFTTAAIDFITASADRPFFAYLSFNCPHTPLQVPDEYVEPYRKLDLGHDQFPSHGQPLAGPAKTDETARIYAMITNIDDNLARLFRRLDELRLVDNTIVVFFTDNGPQQMRYNNGFRGRKGSVYEGGIRVPCFLRWPARIPSNVEIAVPVAHIDLAPTLLAACGVPLPPGVQFDGRNIMPFFENDTLDWPDRTFCFQWHRGDAPERYRAFAVVDYGWKLVQPTGVQPNSPFDPQQLELYNLLEDPYEQHNLAKQHPTEVERLLGEYDRWFDDVSSARGFDPPRIHLGTPHESPTTLTRQDWRGPRAGWAPNDLGHWEVEVVGTGVYDIRLRFSSSDVDETAVFRLGGLEQSQTLAAGATTTVFRFAKLPLGPHRLEAWLEASDLPRGVDYVDVIWHGTIAR